MNSHGNLSSIESTTIASYHIFFNCSMIWLHILFFRNRKVNLPEIFYQNSKFITGKQTFTQGSLSLRNDECMESKRLIGTVYFKKNGTGFDTNSPENHFKSFITPSGTAHDTHIQWLQDIRETVWARVTNENETMRNPFYSYTKLLRRLPVPTLLQSTLKNLYQLALQNLSHRLSLLSWSWKREKIISVMMTAPLGGKLPKTWIWFLGNRSTTLILNEG